MFRGKISTAGCLVGVKEAEVSRKTRDSLALQLARLLSYPPFWEILEERELG